jgi:hypothetical protein
MVSNQVLGARVAAGLLILSLALSGCAHFRHHPQAAPEPTAAAAAPAAPSGEAAAAPASEMTATEAALSSAPTQATPEPTAADASEVNPGAPMHYTVKKGDTLWGIASMYLKDPWLWPEVWIINPQVPNPHLIYPGDTLALAYGAGGQVQVRLESPGSLRLDPRLRSAALENAIPTIPYAAIAPFLSRPAVMTNEEIRHAPYVVAFRNMHQAAGNDVDVYIRNLSAAAENARYSVMHVGNPLVDPDDGKVVGYEGIYTATALVRRPGDPAKVALFDLARETLAGDRLVSADTDTPLNFTPHPPASDIHGRIINAVDGTRLSGPFRIVVINRGKRHGIEPGTVLAIDHQGEVVRDLYRNGRSIGGGINSTWAPQVQLPNERSGTMLVFKSFDRVSYALVVGASDLIRVGDPVRNP